MNIFWALLLISLSSLLSVQIIFTDLQYRERDETKLVADFDGKVVFVMSQAARKQIGTTSKMGQI